MDSDLVSSTVTTTPSTPVTATPTIASPNIKDTHTTRAVNKDLDDDDFFLYFGFGSNLLESRIRVNSPSATLLGVGRLSGYHLGITGWVERWQGGAANIFASDECHFPDASFSDGSCNPLIELPSDDGCCVWGAVWKVSKEHLPCLDEQEGVSEDLYDPFEVTVDLFDCFFDVPQEWAECPTSTDSNTDCNDQAELQQLICKIKSLTSSKTSTVPRRSITVRSYKKVKNSSTIPGNTSLTLPSGKSTDILFFHIWAHFSLFYVSDSYLLVMLKGAIETGLPCEYIKRMASLLSNHRTSIFRDWQKKVSEINWNNLKRRWCNWTWWRIFSLQTF